MPRDFAAEMRAIMDAETSGGPYAAPLVAEHIVGKLRATDPDLLAGWLDSQAVAIIRHAINLRDCSVRTHNRLAARRSVFRKAAEEFEAGDPESLVTNFLGEVYRVEGGMKKPLRDMRAGDLSFAADDFSVRAQDNAMRASFLRALARKVGDRPVGDVFIEDQLVAMWNSIGGDS